ncbi:MAG TPA: glycosyltransferase family 4 protein [Acidimicrobiales bacterium]|jgi:glycosyltransferase involved in cell wall biosynthesis|nr:glycosyltransferase family 4 protein [Acidimicrobiales bacterium]
MADAIHQFVPSFVPRDAIGTHVRAVRDLLRGMGIESDVYVRESRGAAKGEARDYLSYQGARPGERTWLLYQLSTGSKMAEHLLARPEPKLVDYHNITPPGFFFPWEAHVGVELDHGRRQIPLLADVTDLAFNDSAFNESELIEVGFRKTVVAPIFVDYASFDQGVDAGLLDRLLTNKRGAHWLFVGRIAPNKCQHEVVKALAAYRRLYDPQARLTLVGGSSSHAYLTAIERYVDALGLEDAVTLTGSIGQPQLAAHFQAADVFVCLSEHEGFCVPLLEAMHNRVPIVAYDATAVPETLGQGGLLLTDKSPVAVASVVARVVGDDGLRDALVVAGQARLADFSTERVRAQWVDAVKSVVG